MSLSMGQQQSPIKKGTCHRVTYAHEKKHAESIFHWALWKGLASVRLMAYVQKFVNKCATFFLK